ncbi:MAG: glutamine-hydrolyzing GMP synthase subunit GuaA [Euryarchaeota archaeon]|nr:glutamine-hydrolyzing GMP synthase subunit GuaA [Euryarchaeota archaeon]
MFDAEAFVNEEVKRIRDTIRGKAIIACSGGVDSTVAAALVSKAIGDRLLTVYVDNGFMRKGETREVEDLFKRVGMNYLLVDASDDFFSAMIGIIDPEEKRKIIGNQFIRIFEREAKKYGASYLVQGTIAPDWIESGDGTRGKIKTHHNVGGIPDDMDLELIEPLRDLYKDEVRMIARYLGVEVAERQPFPGPALAVRIIGEVNRESVAIVREACAIVEEEMERAAKAGTMILPWQYFAVLLPSQTVGVRDSARAYGRTIAVRAVESIDGMDAAYSKIPHEILDRISTRITDELNDSINRVVYDITNKPPATIEYE